MIALLRYRKIPYKAMWSDPLETLTKGALADLKIDPPSPGLLPTFILPDETGNLKAVTDSTPLIRRFEEEHQDRKCLPKDSVLNFINYLLEDFADEWVTKYMFHYRWHFKDDADNAGTLLPLNLVLNLPKENLNSMKTYIADRQISRLGMVGSSDSTAPMIEASYKRFLGMLEAHFENLPYLLGSRPSSADFALFGQLSQLVGFDPTSRSLAHQISPRTVAWVGIMEDLSGLEPNDDDWIDVNNIPDSLKMILSEVGKVYAPALIANAKAHNEGSKIWEAEIDGCTWTQQTFSYQAKCLKWINDEFRQLDGGAQQKVKNIFEGTNCMQILN
jgi:glutathione S-transferase